MTRITKWAIAVPCGIILLVFLFPVALHTWDSYQARQAGRAVMAAATALSRGDLLPQLRLRKSVARSDLSQAFATGHEVVGYDPIGLAVNAYEIQLRVANGDLYVFDAFKLHGEWTLDCCNHATAEELEERMRRH